MEDLAGKHQLPHGDRYLQGYEDAVDILENALNKSGKHDRNRPHLCRAIWRQETRSTSPRGQTEISLNVARSDEHLQANSSRSISMESASSGTRTSRKLSQISTAPSSNSQTPCRVNEHRKWWVGFGTRVLQTHQHSSATMSYSQRVSRS